MMIYKYKQAVVIRGIVITVILCAILALSGCGNKSVETEETSVTQQEDHSENQPKNTESGADVEDTSDVVSDEGKSLDVDFASLQAKNPEIFGWLSVPGTNIDMPLLQSQENSEYYVTHDADKNPSTDGAAYTEVANFTDMCSFNTVVHGSKALFSDLINFENPDFFEKNDTFYIYLPDNVLTYSIWTVYRRENNSMLRAYNFADAVGCREFLDDVYNGRYVGKQIREGWEGAVTEYNFLVTLTIDDPTSDDQLVVIGGLVNDAAGTLHRDVIEKLDLGPNLFLEQ